MASAKEWPDGLNKNFYDVSITPKENVKKLTFESGKERSYLLNSSCKKQISLSLDLWTSSEESIFWEWYNNTILSGSLSFNLTDLVSGSGTTEYILSGTPTVEDIYPKKLTLSLEEV